MPPQTATVTLPNGKYKTVEVPDRPVRVYCDGIWDLFHYGHALALKQAKELFHDVVLIVGVCTDEDTIREKGITVFNQTQRGESVRHCKYADIVLDDASVPWIVTPLFLEEHSIDFVVHGNDACFTSDGHDCYAPVKGMGRYISVQRTNGISTTDIIAQILEKADHYKERNRKREGGSYDKGQGP